MIYLGVALPIIGVGLVTLATGLLPAVRIFAGLLIAAGLVGIVNQVTRPA